MKDHASGSCAARGEPDPSDDFRVSSAAPPVPPRSLPTVTIAIPAYNEQRNIGALLEHLRQHPPANADVVEILVEVSGSTDGTTEAVGGWAVRWPVVRALDSGRRLGLFTALQHLLDAAKGEIVVRLDADVRLEDATIGRLVEALADRSVGVVGPRVVPLTSTSYLVSAATRAEWGLHHEVSSIEPKTTVVQGFRNVGVLLPRESALEDAALQAELVGAGKRAVYVADATVHIAPPSDAKGFIHQRVRTIRIIHAYMRRGHHRPATAAMSHLVDATVVALRARRVAVGDLLIFGALELSARVMARAQDVMAGPPPPLWDPVPGTKAPRWTASAPDRDAPAGSEGHGPTPDDR